MEATAPVIDPHHIAGYRHGKANFRRGIGLPRGYKQDGHRGPPESAFLSPAYGKGYIHGWTELAAAEVVRRGDWKRGVR